MLSRIELGPDGPDDQNPTAPQVDRKHLSIEPAVLMVPSRLPPTVSWSADPGSWTNSPLPEFGRQQKARPPPPVWKHRLRHVRPQSGETEPGTRHRRCGGELTTIPEAPMTAAPFRRSGTWPNVRGSVYRTVSEHMPDNSRMKPGQTPNMSRANAERMTRSAGAVPLSRRLRDGVSFLTSASRTLMNSFGNCTSILLHTLALSLNFDFPSDDLTNGPHAWPGKTSGPLAGPRDSARHDGQRLCAPAGEAGASHDHIVTGKGNPHFVVAVSLDELIPYGSARLAPTNSTKTDDELRKLVPAGGRVQLLAFQIRTGASLWPSPRG